MNSYIDRSVIFPLLIFAMSLSACIKALPSNLQPERIVSVQTEDGWGLQLRHHGGHGHPVLLMHGMSANHYNWDFRAEASPVGALQQAGYDVWVGTLRGDPGTVAPDKKTRTHIRFDDHARSDVPALIDAVLAQTGQQDLFFVGHSMGGMLLYTSTKLQPQTIRAGVAISSPATFQADRKNYTLLRRFGFLVAARHGRVPMRPFAHLGLVRFRPLLRILGNPDNLDRALLKGMSAAALENLPRATVRQAREWLREREFVDETGARWLDGAEHVEVPLLVLGGQDDRIAAEPDVAHACRLFPTCEYRALAKLNGFSIDYGHIDTVVGRSAPAEIYPLIIRFLDRHRATIETRPH